MVADTIHATTATHTTTHTKAKAVVVAANLGTTGRLSLQGNVGGGGLQRLKTAYVVSVLTKGGGVRFGEWRVGGGGRLRGLGLGFGEWGKLIERVC